MRNIKTQKFYLWNINFLARKPYSNVVLTPYICVRTSDAHHGTLAENDDKNRVGTNDYMLQERLFVHVKSVFDDRWKKSVRRAIENRVGVFVATVWTGFYYYV